MPRKPLPPEERRKRRLDSQRRYRQKLRESGALEIHFIVRPEFAKILTEFAEITGCADRLHDCIEDILTTQIIDWIDKNAPALPELRRKLAEREAKRTGAAQ